MTDSSPWAALLADTAQRWNDFDLSASAEALSRPYAAWQASVAATASSVPIDRVPSHFGSLLADAAPTDALRLVPGPAASHAVDNPLDTDMTQVAALLRNGQLSARELTQHALTRLHALHRQTNACVSIDDEAALAQAERCDVASSQGAPRGPLHGVPLAHKDLLYRDGIEVGCGLQTRLPRPYEWPGTAPVLQKLDAAGAINLGRLHMTEWAFDPSGANEELGPCRNPWKLSHVPGGSSSGSAVVVAGRAVYAALGTDTGGSIRIPAALCGITGLKPTRGVVDTAGAMPLSHSNDHIGPLARSAADCALMMQAISGAPTLRPSLLASLQQDLARVASGAVADLKGLRIGVPQSFFRDEVDARVAAPVDDSLAQLKALGAILKPVPDFDWLALNTAGAMVTRVEAAARLAKLQTMGDIGEALLARFEEGVAIPGWVYAQLLNERAGRLQEFLASVMAHVDVLHVPVCRVMTPAHTVFEQGGAAAATARMELTVLNRPFNFLGVPGLSLPCGFATQDDGTRMPVGFQLIGRPYADAQLLAIGAAWQAATGWHRERPPLMA